jgi:hypothetical protein
MKGIFVLVSLSMVALLGAMSSIWNMVSEASAEGYCPVPKDGSGGAQPGCIAGGGSPRSDCNRGLAREHKDFEGVLQP